MRRWLQRAPWAVALMLIPALVLAASALQPQTRVDEWTDRYDDEFRKWTKRYFGPGFDWRWFKAQGVVESGLKPSAVSKSGTGIMQLLPRTYASIKRENPSFGAIHDARWNIAAGISYNRENYDYWDGRVGHGEALRFTFASYNAGPGRIRQVYDKAKNAGRDASRWVGVEKYAPRITRHYVRKIHQLMGADVGRPSEHAIPVENPPG